MYVCPSVCPYVCLSVCPSVCPYVCLSVCPYVCLSVCPYVCPYACLSVPMFVSLSVPMICPWKKWETVFFSGHNHISCWNYGVMQVMPKPDQEITLFDSMYFMDFTFYKIHVVV